MRAATVFSIILAFPLGGAALIHDAEAQTRSVLVNSVRLSDATVKGLEQKYRVVIQDGDYWYDRTSGAWGLQGGPTVGFTLAGLNLGGPLKSDASAGNTGVFINGRQLHQYDVVALMQLGPVYQGRYWVDANGYFGFEGGPALGNLWLAAQAARRQGAQTTYTRSGSMFGSDGNGCLVFNDPSSGTSASSGC
jgi:hypothetical protein